MGNWLQRFTRGWKTPCHANANQQVGILYYSVWHISWNRLYFWRGFNGLYVLSIHHLFGMHVLNWEMFIAEKNLDIFSNFIGMLLQLCMAWVGESQEFHAKNADCEWSEGLALHATIAGRLIPVHGAIFEECWAWNAGLPLYYYVSF